MTSSGGCPMMYKICYFLLFVKVVKISGRVGSENLIRTVPLQPNLNVSYINVLFIIKAFLSLFQLHQTRSITMWKPVGKSRRAFTSLPQNTEVRASHLSQMPLCCAEVFVWYWSSYFSFSCCQCHHSRGYLFLWNVRLRGEERPCSALSC